MKLSLFLVVIVVVVVPDAICDGDDSKWGDSYGNGNTVGGYDSDYGGNGRGNYVGDGDGDYRGGDGGDYRGDDGGDYRGGDGGDYRGGDGGNYRGDDGGDYRGSDGGDYRGDDGGDYRGGDGGDYRGGDGDGDYRGGDGGDYRDSDDEGDYGRGRHRYGGDDEDEGDYRGNNRHRYGGDEDDNEGDGHGDDDDNGFQPTTPSWHPNHHTFKLPDWRYESGPEDPSHWKEKYPNCDGNAQSPINIIPGESVSKSNINPLVFNGYDENSHEFILKNVEGHTAGLSVAGLTRPSVRGADVNNDYLLDQFHFHWGGNDSVGSEHLVQGTHYPLEMHLVHYSDAYANAKTAQKEPKGLMVLSVLFQIGETNNPDFDVFLKAFGQIVEPDQNVTVKLHPLRKLLPSNVQDFYTYHGSLTTPPCYQSVVWVVFKDHVLVSEQQLNDFRMLHNGIQNHILINNFRPVQPLNGRVLAKATW